MKYLLLLSSLVVSLSNVKSQNYYPYPDTGWIQSLQLGIYNGFGFERYLEELSYERDTFLQGHNYKMISFSGNQSEFVRQEDGKLIWAQQQGINYVETTLWDFSLQVGDTLIGYGFYASEPITVIKKEKILSTSGDSLWYMELEVHKFWPDTLRWMEGIGDLQFGLLPFIFPDGGFSHICTLNKNNQTLQEATWPPIDCNCDYIHGQDLDHDGYRNHVHMTKSVTFKTTDWPPHFVKPDKHRRCDTLVIFNSTGLSMVILDGETMDEIHADSIAPQQEKFFFYHISNTKNILVTHQLVDIYSNIEIRECDWLDCDDQDSTVNSGYPEIPYNGKDNDCNPETPDDDLDMDGFPVLIDCDDNNLFINPNQVEIAYNGFDDDCNSITPDDDLDNDQFNLADDCNDLNPDIFPGATEIPNNGIDEDCNGEDLMTQTHDLAGISISIFPNPVSGTLFIASNEKVNLWLKLFNSGGQILFSQACLDPIDVQGLQPGVYFIEITSLPDKLRFVEKIAVIR